MTEFLLCILQYLLIMAVLGVIAFAGAKLGIKLRKKKDIKLAAAENASEEN